jgi:hypothetical protein
MIITKAEAMKAVIDGEPIQHRCGTDFAKDLWVNTFTVSYDIIEKLRLIDVSTNYEFRLKPKVKSISYRCYLYTNLSGTVSVSVCNFVSIDSQKNVKKLQILLNGLVKLRL